MYSRAHLRRHGHEPPLAYDVLYYFHIIFRLMISKFRFFYVYLMYYAYYIYLMQLYITEFKGIVSLSYHPLPFIIALPLTKSDVRPLI